MTLTRLNKTLLCACALLFFALAANADEAGRDKFRISFDKPLMVGDQMLQPGTYVLEQRTDNIPARANFNIWQDGKILGQVSPVKYEPDNPGMTKAWAATVDGQHYLDRIQAAGKGYGWDFVADENARDKMKEMREAVDVRIIFVPLPVAVDASTASREAMKSSTMAQAGNANSKKPIEVIGCVSGPNNGNYLLTTRNGKTFMLRGDADHLREYTSKTVTIWGELDGKTDQFMPEAMKVTTVRPMSETCDMG